MLKRILVLSVYCLLLTSLAWAGAGWKKTVRPAKPSIYSVMQEVQGVKQDLQALAQKVKELEVLQPAELAKMEERLNWLEKQVNAFGNWFSIIGGILAAIVTVIIGMSIFMFYKLRQLRKS